MPLESELSDAVLVAAARDFGTPVYVIDVAVVASAAAMMEAAFPRPWVWQYSLKGSAAGERTSCPSASGGTRTPRG